MNRAWVLGVLMATSAVAETEVDAYGLGYHMPVPESWLKLDEDLSIRVRVLHANGQVADVVKTPETLEAEVTFYGREGAADRDVRLLCSAYFLDAQAGSSGFVIHDQLCYEGRLSDATGIFVPLTLQLRFKPVARDPKGTSAVVVQIHDTVVNQHISLSPTYDWQGGR